MGILYRFCRTVAKNTFKMELTKEEFLEFAVEYGLKVAKKPLSKS